MSKVDNPKSDSNTQMFVSSEYIYYLTKHTSSSTSFPLNKKLNIKDSRLVSTFGDRSFLARAH